MTTQNHLPPEYPFPEAGAPSPSATPAPTPPSQTDQPWQSMYKAERKKTRVLGATTVAVSLLAVGLGAWGLNAQGANASGGPGQLGGPGATSQFGPPGMNGNSSQGGTGTLPGQGTMPGQGGTGTLPGQGSTGTLPGQGSTGALPGPMGQDLGSLLLNSDGSVNTDAVQQFVQRVPSGALDQILAMAVTNGELTQDQADQIAAAAGSTSTGTTNNTSAQDT